MTETLLIGSAPEWITIVVGVIAMILGIGVIAFLWKHLEPLVDKRIESKNIETNKRLDRLEERSSRQDSNINDNRRSIEKIREVEHQQDLSINQLVNDVKHLDKSLSTLSDKIDANHSNLASRVDKILAFLIKEN